MTAIATHLGAAMPLADEVLTAMYGRCDTCGAPLGPRITLRSDGIIRASQSCREDPNHEITAVTLTSVLCPVMLLTLANSG